MSLFRFKRFAVDQAGCAMKINTDGVLLGAMAQASFPKRILDIGTGTGVIALMLAQRFSAAVVEAIEIDPVAAEAARLNFEGTSFSERISSYAQAMADFKPEASYDLIVSNPPYFLGSLTNQDKGKRIARHTDMSFFSELLERSARWLVSTGSLQLVLPVPLAEQIMYKATQEYGLVLQGLINIRSFSADPPIRRILSLGKMPHHWPLGEDEFVIYESQGVYSPAYQALLKDFFLAF